MTTWNWILFGLFVWVTILPLAAVAVSKKLHSMAKGYPAVCRCGHLAEVHQHYRPGHECSVCDCDRFCHGG